MLRAKEIFTHAIGSSALI